MKKKYIIKTIGRKLYVISYKPKYKPVPTENILKIARKTSERFEDIKYCPYLIAHILLQVQLSIILE